jgi:hypothetical protein
VKLPLPPEEESEFRDVTADPHLDAIRTGLLRGAAAQELESLSALNTYSCLSSGAMTYDSYDKEIVLFGGCSGTTPRGYTWVFKNFAWSNDTPSSGGPGARYYDSMAMDDGISDEYVLLQGGLTGSGSCDGKSGACEDTWEFKAGSWTSLGNPLSPYPGGLFGSGMAMFHTPGSGGVSDVVYCCGDSGGGTHPSSEWYYFSSGAWTRSCSSPCASATDGAMLPIEQFGTGNETITSTNAYNGPTIFGGWSYVTAAGGSIWMNEVWLESGYGLTPDGYM